MKQLLYPTLSYKVIGICMEVHNKLGPMHREKVYQNAVEELFKTRNIKYLREQRIPLYIDRKKIGNYFIDFIVEEKMCLELKAHFYIMRNFDMQILSYMKSLRLRLGIVVNFRSERLWSKRLVLPDKYLC